MTLPFDNTAGFVTGVAFANTSIPMASITVTAWDDSGARITSQAIPVAESGHTSFVLPSQFPLTAGKRGIRAASEFGGGGLAGLGLRFSSSRFVHLCSIIVSQ